MKLIIDIPEKDYKEVLKDTYSGTPFENRIFTAIANGTSIPENTTNEDVMKAIFPSMKIERHHSFARFVYGDESYIPCSYKWLDALYQTGDKYEIDN